MRPLRIDPDTKDTLVFLVGLFGIVAQGILASFQVPVQPIMLTTFGAMIGLGIARPIIKGQKATDEPTPPPPRREPGD